MSKAYNLKIMSETGKWSIDDLLISLDVYDQFIVKSVTSRSITHDILFWCYEYWYFTFTTTINVVVSYMCVFIITMLLYCSFLYVRETRRGKQEWTLQKTLATLTTQEIERRQKKSTHTHDTTQKTKKICVILYWYLWVEWNLGLL